MLHQTTRIDMPIVIGTYPFVKVDKKLDPNDNRLNNTFSYPENGNAKPYLQLKHFDSMQILLLADPPTYEQNKNNKSKFSPFHHVYHHPVVV